MEQLLRDVYYVVRVLGRTPAFTITVILTLALGIGASTAVFTAIDNVLLRPLAFPNGDRLVRLTEVHKRSEETGVGLLRLEDWKRRNTTFKALTAYAAADASDTTGTRPERVRAAGVAPSFLAVWGVQPELGRGFSSREFRSGGPCARLISDRYWHTRLHADPNVLGRAIRLNNVACPIVGVMPASFHFPDPDVDVWSPVHIDAPYERRTTFSSYRTAVGRLKAGVTLEQARADLNLIQARLGKQYPKTDKNVDVRLAPLKRTIVGAADRTLWLLFAAVSVLLVIACTNIAALLLARATQREPEIAIRYSLGASRGAVFRQMLVEAGALSLAGAAFGLIVAAMASKAFRVFVPKLPRVDEIGMDGRILVYTTVLVVIVTLLCGLLPALRTVRADGPTSGTSRTPVSSRQSLQWLLVGVQVALSVILLADAGLLLRSFDKLSRVDPGFDQGHVLAFRMSRVYNEPPAQWSPRIHRWLNNMKALPGVEAAAASFLRLPGIPGQTLDEFRLTRGEATKGGMIADRLTVSPGYFETMKIPVVTGDVCHRRADLPDASSVAEVMVNRRFVNRYLQNQPSIGLHLFRSVPRQYGGGIAQMRVAGVVGNARERGLENEPAPTVYVCDTTDPNPWFLVRTSRDPAAAIGMIRRKMQDLAPLQSVYPIAPLEEQIDGIYAQDWLRTMVLTVFALSALALACLGIYGTLSYVINRRRREVGLRVALGAQQNNVVSQFLRDVMRVVGIACIAGVTFSLLSARVLSGMLFGVSPVDPFTLVVVVVVVTVVAVFAALLPAIRASRVDPMNALREE